MVAESNFRSKLTIRVLLGELDSTNNDLEWYDYFAALYRLFKGIPPLHLCSFFTWVHLRRNGPAAQEKMPLSSPCFTEPLFPYLAWPTSSHLMGHRVLTPFLNSCHSHSAWNPASCHWAINCLHRQWASEVTHTVVAEITPVLLHLARNPMGHSIPSPVVSLWVFP